jgi:peptidoglycan lytic transglycosylase G
MNNLDLFEDPAREGQFAGQQNGRRNKRSARKRQRRRKMSGRAAALFALAFLVAVVGGGGLVAMLALDRFVSVPDYSGAGTGSVTVQIRDGDFGETIGRRLEDADVVKSSKAYVQAAAKDPKSSSIQPGFYQMRKKMSASAALAMLLDPKSRAGNQITLPEGLRVGQIIKRLAEKTGIPVREFQALTKNPAGLGLPREAKGELEGYLWPGQYNLNPNASAKDTLKMLVAGYRAYARANDLEAKAQQADMTPHELMTMASIIQAESGRPSDMPKISRVIHNRLEQNWQLQMDSTVMYALNKFGIVASNDETAINHPYNTYRNHGLPPGPIAGPGAKAVEAALNPKAGPWMYFVTVDPGRGITKYAVTQEQHNRLVAQLNEYLRQNPQGGG